MRQGLVHKNTKARLATTVSSQIGLRRLVRKNRALQADFLSLAGRDYPH